MRALPSIVFGPVDSPPCLGQRQAPRLVLMAVAVQRSPKGHRWTPQTCLLSRIRERTRYPEGVPMTIQVRLALQTPVDPVIKFS